MKIYFETLLLTAAMVVTTCPVHAQDQNSNQSQMADDMNQPMTAQHFISEAAMTDMKEIHAGTMALQKTDNADVKKFAKMLIKDHTKASNKLQALAEKKGLNFPDTNTMAMSMDSKSDRLHGNQTDWKNSQNNSTARWSDNDHTNMTMTAGSDNHVVKNAELMTMNPSETNENNATGMRPMKMEMMNGSEFDRAFAAKMVQGHDKAVRTFEMAASNLTDEDLKKYAEKTLPTLRHHLMMARELQMKVGMGTASQ